MLKKILLSTLATGIVAGSFGQSIPFKSKLNSSQYNKREIMNKKVEPKDQPSGSSEGTPLTPSGERAAGVNETVIGTTTYDLQTNGAVQNRLFRHADGTFSAVWTQSKVPDPYADRGTGYNYFNGTSWMPSPSSRIETDRCGWSSIAGTDTGAEIIMNHNTVASKMHLVKRPAKGTGTWGQSLVDGADTPGNWWPRMVTGGPDGNTVHLISLTYPVAGAGGGAIYKGMDGAITYSRSLNGGTTWDIFHVLLPGMDSSNYLGFNGDDYAITTDGNNVAFVVGGALNDVFLMKSSDNGTTWKKTILYKHPIPLWDTKTKTSDIDGDGEADILNVNDGNVSIILDKANKAHVTFGLMRVMHDDLLATGYSYYPGTSGLLYWNENMGVSCPLVIADILDLNGDDSLTLEGETPAVYYNSLTSYSSSSIDQAGNIYVTYSGAVEGTSNGNGQFYRNLYVVKSPDGGISWTQPYNITRFSHGDDADVTEAVFGSMWQKADSNLYIIYMKDAEPGLTVQGDGDPSSLNEIVFVKVPVANIPGPASEPEFQVCPMECSTFEITASATQDTCSSGKGRGTVNVVGGGTDPYSYKWNSVPPQTTATATGLKSGTYVVDVADAQGCSGSVQVIIPNYKASLEFSVASTPDTCMKGIGTATISAINGGKAPYAYSWNSVPPQTTITATALKAGMYSALITDAQGCTSSKETIVENKLALALSINSDPATCGMADGSAKVTITSSNPLPYTYTWDSNPALNLDSVTGLSSGVHTITVKDAIGCVITNQVNINDGNGPAVNLTSTNVTCYGLANGTASVVPTGGIQPYTYTWSNSTASTSAVTALSPGIITVTVKDSAGCMSLGTATITQPDSLKATVSSSNVACNNATTGTAQVNPSGGTSPYTYSWSNGTTTNVAASLSASLFSVTVTDAKGCTLSRSIEITEPLGIVLNYQEPDSVVKNATTGEISGFASGGIAPYTYSWSNGPTTAGIMNISAGIYTVTVSDANGCTSSKTFDIPIDDSGLGEYNGSSDFIISPVPASSNANIKVSGLKSRIVDLTVFDNRGQNMVSKRISVNNGFLNYDLDLSKFANGLYLIRIQGETEMVTGKVIKQ